MPIQPIGADTETGELPGPVEGRIEDLALVVARPVDRLKSLEGKWRAHVLAMESRLVDYGANISAWTTDATSIASAVDVPFILTPYGAYTLNPIYTYLGGDPDRRGASYPAQVTVKATGLSYASADLPFRIAFCHEGGDTASFPIFELEVFGQGGPYNNRLRVWVDGVLVNTEPVDGPAGGGALWRTRIALPDTSKHVIALELSGLNCWPTNIKRHPNAKITRWIGPKGPRVIGLGDSQMEGQNGVANRIGNSRGFFPRICQSLGIHDYWQSGIGETGLLAKGIDNTRNNQVERLSQDVLVRNAQSVWMFASQNDVSKTKAALKTALLANVDAILADDPTTEIRLFGNFQPTTGAGLTSVRDAYKEVAAERGLLFLDASTWLTGTGNAGAPAGNGNRDKYVSVDGSHLSDLGHREFAVWCLARIEAGYAEPGLA